MVICRWEKRKGERLSGEGKPNIGGRGKDRFQRGCKHCWGKEKQEKVPDLFFKITIIIYEAEME